MPAGRGGGYRENACSCSTAGVYSPPTLIVAPPRASPGDSRQGRRKKHATPLSENPSDLRRKMFLFCMQWSTTHAIEHNGCFAIRDPTTYEMVSAAVCFPPSEDKVTPPRLSWPKAWAQSVGLQARAVRVLGRCCDDFGPSYTSILNTSGPGPLRHGTQPRTCLLYHTRRPCLAPPSTPLMGCGSASTSLDT